MADFVRLTITGVYSTCEEGGKNGGSMVVYGNKCEKHKCSKTLCENGGCGGNIAGGMLVNNVDDGIYYPKEGDKVDVYDSKSRNWVPGMILTII